MLLRLPGLVHPWITFDFAGHSWLADWIAGVGQALGAFFTLAAVVVALRAEKRADRLRVQEQADRDKAQARMISVSVLEGDPPISTAVPQTKREVLISNDSSEPIFRAHILRVGAVGDPAGERSPWWQFPEDQRVISPDAGSKFPVVYDGGGNWPDDPVVVRIQFQDSHGLVWSRDNDDPVVRVLSGADVVEIDEDTKPSWWMRLIGRVSPGRHSGG